MFGGLKKIIRKNKKGFSKLVKAGARVAVTAAAPVVAAGLASKAVGVVQRAAAAPARRKAKAEKAAKLEKALAVEIKRPDLVMMSSRETNGAKAMPGGATI